MLGTLINAGGIVIGGWLGLLFAKRISAALQQHVMSALGLCVLAVGFLGLLDVDHVIVMIVSMVIGVLIGSAIDLDRRFTLFSESMERRFAKGENSKFALGLMSASLLFCVGSMSILGSFEGGLQGVYTILLTKTVLDFVSAMMLASSFGVSVLFSSIIVLVYQGLLTVLAAFVSPLLSVSMIADMSATGSLLIVALGLNMLKVTDLKVANLLPAIVIAPIISACVGLIG